MWPSYRTSNTLAVLRRPPWRQPPKSQFWLGGPSSVAATFALVPEEVYWDWLRNMALIEHQRITLDVVTPEFVALTEEMQWPTNRPLLTHYKIG